MEVITSTIQRDDRTEVVFEKSLSPFIDFLHGLSEDRVAVLTSFFTCEQFISNREAICDHPEYLDVVQIALYPDRELIVEKALRTAERLDEIVTTSDLIALTAVYVAKKLPFIALCSSPSSSFLAFH